eukprot:CAMPEP_0117438050 /NCGR_PEP_ID=MMETSP0759-20121206/1849_1 /TAXON_ID=63605 /ORGANISM="Percolomonas cosmopolitus, Strain WS" /LENGTH=354 /DNA_ID=CAMNT_0005229721 /DNA_START=301 /DNA_END=1365 /DNA_ORIENTATION=-
MIDTLTPLEPKIPPVPFTIQSTGPSYHLPSEDIEKKGVYSESAHEFNEETVKLPSEEITTTESPHDEIVEKEVVITSGLPEESREGHTSPKKAGLGAKIKGLFSSKGHKEKKDREMKETAVTPEEKRGGMFSSMKKKRALHHEKKSHKHEVHESFGGVLSSSGAPDVVTPTEEGALGSTDETFEREDVAPDQWEREPPLVEERLETVPVGTTTLIEGETAEGVTKRPFGVSKQEESPLLKEDKKESTFYTSTPKEGLIEEEGTLGSSTNIENSTLAAKPASVATHFEESAPKSESRIRKTVVRGSPTVLHFEAEPIIHSREEFDKLPKERRIDVQEMLREQQKAASKEGHVVEE